MSQDVTDVAFDCTARLFYYNFRFFAWSSQKSTQWLKVTPHYVILFVLAVANASTGFVQFSPAPSDSLKWYIPGYTVLAPFHPYMIMWFIIILLFQSPSCVLTVCFIRFLWPWNIRFPKWPKIVLLKNLLEVLLSALLWKLDLQIVQKHGLLCNFG